MHKPVTRWQAFLIHLGISLIIFLVLAWIIVKIWYPFPYFSYDGGWQGIRIIAGVDLVLGPLLTLIVYKPGKKGLKLDLSIIAGIQVAALAWGVWITWHERPVAIVYTLDHFVPVTAGELRDHDRDPASLRDLDSRHHPALVLIDMPEDIDARQRLLSQSLATGVPLYLFTDRYRRIDDADKSSLIELSDDVLRHLRSNADTQAKLARFRDSGAGRPEDYLFIPLYARDGRIVLILDRQTLDTVDIIRADVSDYLKRRLPRGLHRSIGQEAALPAQPT